MAPELIKGGVTALIIMITMTLLFRFIDARLMGRDSPLDSELIVNPYFRLFTLVCIIGGLFASPAVLKLGFAGTHSELLFALCLCLLGLGMVVFLSIQAFLTSVHIKGKKLIIRTPLDQKEIDLGALHFVTINSRFQFELTDAKETIRFCHYIEGKRALIEYIIEHAPFYATRELRKLLNKS